MEMPDRQHVVVIGAGVIGLSAAIHLQQDGYAVTVVAKDFPQPAETIDSLASINYTSPWGGAHNRWIPPPLGSPFEHDLSVRTYARMAQLSDSNPEAGITFLRGVEYIEAPGPEYAEITEARARGEWGMEDFRVLYPAVFPDDRVKWGCEYKTWCVNPMVYCAFLLRRLVMRGGKVLRRELRDPSEVYALPEFEGVGVDMVVNASGIGFGDREVYPTRGQTCLVANTCDATVTRQNADGSWTFCVPRGFDGGTVVGGTKEVDNWDPKASEAVREQLLARFAETYPEILDSRFPGGYRVIRDIVGRRPTRRGGLRLELEKNGECSVVHAYGLGGRGYELSWGVAQEVLKLVNSELDQDRDMENSYNATDQS